MIPRNLSENQCQNHSEKPTESQNQTKSKVQVGTHFTDPVNLLEQLDLSPEQMQFSPQANQDFQFKVPKAYVDKIQKGNPKDPLLLQIFPVQQELEYKQGYSRDPLAEAQSLFQPGLLQKYDGRALLLVTPACTINCRYCFRRHYPYDDKGHFWTQINNNIQLINQDDSINEVILSGGDPLSLSNERLAALFHSLEAIPHLKRIRIHSRFPVVEPNRIDDEFLEILASSHLQIIMVLHINHTQEIGTDSKVSLEKLHNQKTILLNQSVLLRGVNDDVDILRQLSEILIENHIIPYYLHMLDRVQGSAHFEVSDEDAVQIHQQLRGVLSGYMLPQLVREIAGEKSKFPIYEA